MKPKFGGRSKINMKIDLLKSKKDLYLLALDYLNRMDADEFNIGNYRIENNSISYLVHHKFIPVPSIKIELQLFNKSHILSNFNYYLYIDDNLKFIDEFLVII
jgi:hypothetical protein